jgi:hypothetical protein
MSAALTARAPVPRPLGPPPAGGLPACDSSSLSAEGVVVRRAPSARGGAGKVAGSWRPARQGVYAGRGRSENNRTSVCKYLQTCAAPRAKSSPGISASPVTDAATLFINALRVEGKVMVGQGLAHRLRDLYLYGYGLYPFGCVQYRECSGASAPPKRRQARRGRACASPWRVDSMGVGCGSSTMA